MPSIGSKNFHILNGQVQGFEEGVEDITRPHVDGLGLRMTGLRSKPFTMVSITDREDAAAADTAFDGYQAIVGTVVNLQDQLGETHTNFVVRGCRRLMHKQTPRIVGGNNTSGVVLSCEWTLQAAGDPAATP